MTRTNNIFFLFIITHIIFTPTLHAAGQPDGSPAGTSQKSHTQRSSRGLTPCPENHPYGSHHAQAPCCAHQHSAYGYPTGAGCYQRFAPYPGAQAGAHTGNVNIVLSSNNLSEQAAQLQASQHTHQEQFQHQHVENITLVSIARGCESFLSGYRWTLFFSFLLAGYAMMYKRIKNDQAFLSRHKNWANWRAYDAQKIESCLAADIQYRYFNPQDPANYPAALAECALDLEHEQMRYSRIMRLYKWLKKWYLYLLFPLSEKDYKEAREARERFEAMRRIYLRLIASRNGYINSQKNQEFSNELPCTLPCCNPAN